MTTPRSLTRCVERSFLNDVLTGLSQPQKRLPCKYFYDERGSQLFDEICELPEYYPTRTELAILTTYAKHITEYFGPCCGLIEFGAGSGLKTRLLLQHLSGSVFYPVDISREHLRTSAQQLMRAFPQVEIHPVVADFTKPFPLPSARRTIHQRVVYFSGSTIGNFTPRQAQRLLYRIATLVGPGGGLLIGVDLKKDSAILEPAYNDAAGITAEFNLNILHRINRELNADFHVQAFRHLAFFDQQHGRIEMHLVSECVQVVRIGDRKFSFSKGETIRTEYSYKYDLDQFAHLAKAAGFSVQEVWTDSRRLFSVQYLKVNSGSRKSTRLGQ